MIMNNSSASSLLHTHWATIINVNNYYCSCENINNWAFSTVLASFTVEKARLLMAVSKHGQTAAITEVRAFYGYIFGKAFSRCITCSTCLNSQTLQLKSPLSWLCFYVLPEWESTPWTNHSLINWCVPGVAPSIYLLLKYLQPLCLTTYLIHSLHFSLVTVFLPLTVIVSQSSQVTVSQSLSRSRFHLVKVS